MLISPRLVRRALVTADSITVYKDPTCGCCDGWITHIKQHGFEMKVTELGAQTLRQLKSDHHIPTALQSCHTAIVDGCVIEGHVPAEELQRFLRERPRALGLAVPGMPAGSPGMEASKKDNYAVLIIALDGTATVYREYFAD